MFLRVVTLAALLFAPFQAQAPATKTEAPAKLPEPRDIIERHIKAVGGRDAILSHKSMHGVGTISIPRPASAARSRSSAPPPTASS